uniref:Cyclic nucleotide-binding domain-containing protein n=1 Tax=Mucochytrium quahogii TaxID=96639 RepID=A0A7S2S0X9_9STRA|mmetsp:Transcript_19254/g.32132  ORF Transcript_19254/g.32132 Transcript_19254/m.32132 type:complete len:390 (+) Transcript_19254:125-1294(+)|eukprot:CAMPEP_0203750534 /NCGR_PEP_ID=MMETSP0098-20131031/4747_1 /ASSEMBLY_ACC=CAM_ASM_000208 /TAXON_ID=96639 /ORGANISM=" , Strain NY0313808BC1" /LENGTH=389 /DNA_ID=CAMNT_0050639881 /DNA_START=92 /DNA_END=1261 /DNA_ORIENTATION=+
MSLSAESAVHDELQQYLAEKGVNSLFVKIVEQLLMEKPDCPVSFIVAYLLKNFPEETKRYAKISESRQSMNNEAKSQEQKDDEWSDEDEDDEDDYVDELPQIKAPSKGNGRRTSVSAGVLSTEQTLEKKVFPKSDEEREKLRTIVAQNVLCKHLLPDEVNTIVDAFEKIEVPGDHDIIVQGDLVAEHYYILGKGSAEVYKDGEKLNFQYTIGDGFGELALMYNAPRAASVKSLEPSELWRLDQVTFKSILMGAAISNRNKYLSFLEKVSILSEMAEAERLKLVDALCEKTYNGGDIIVEQGTPGDEFYIISKGEVKIERDGKFVSTLGEGKYFGEIALLTSKSRQATVTAESSDVQVLTVHRKAFQRVLGPLSDILARNMDAYSEWLTK